MRKENQILRRKIKKPRLKESDRLFYLGIYKIFKGLYRKTCIIRPETIVLWHRKLMQRKWHFSHRLVGRPPLPEKTKDIIISMKKANMRWGSQRISGELLKLGFSVSKKTVARVLAVNGFDPGIRSFTAWSAFLKSQGRRIFACDFFTVNTVFLKRIHVFVMIDVKSRALVMHGVSANPTREWLKNLLRSHFAIMPELPQVLIFDGDSIFSDWMEAFLSNYYNIKLIQTPPRTPTYNGRAERIIRTLRDELTDRVLIYGEQDLRNILNEYMKYYNKARAHSALSFDSPEARHSQKVKDLDKPIARDLVLDGLITDFRRAE